MSDTTQTHGNIDEELFAEAFLVQDWEDSEFPERIKNQYPGWYCMKLQTFNGATMEEVTDWLTENTKYGNYKKVGWYSNCAYSVGVMFESPRDAMMFKLRWN